MTSLRDDHRSGTEQGGSPISAAAALDGQELLDRLDADPRDGLPAAAVAERQARWGPNLVSASAARFLPVLWRQLRSPLLLLLVTAATASYFVGERSDAVIIGVIVAVSVGLGCANEWRAEQTAESLRTRIRHSTVAVRDGRAQTVDVASLVPGDVVELRLGDVVPADVRLLDVTGLECDESVLTGESLPAAKAVGATPPGTALAELTGCALAGTVVHAGRARAVVVAIGRRTEFGRIAAGLSTSHLDTEFQVGLRRFSVLLVSVAAALTTAIFAINVVLDRPVLDALLFSLAIAVGITPQLLPAVVSTSLAAGSRQLSRQRVLVKRLVCIEDLGDVDVLFTDKTGTLTQGRIEFMRAVPATGDPADLLRRGLLCTETTGTDAVGGNALDQALWRSPAVADQLPALAGHQRVGSLPFDHERRMASVLVEGPGGRLMLVTKGAPESVLARCGTVPAAARAALDAEFAAGHRVVAVATRDMGRRRRLTAGDEHSLDYAGLLVFADPPKPDAAAALHRLAGLGVTVKVVTGDNATVAATVGRDLGLPAGGVLTGTDLAGMDDAAFAAALPGTSVFARVGPADKARIVTLQRRSGGGVAFLGDGVNDALALHAADVGISVDTATDVARDAADVILLEKDLGVLAGGVAGGRRIFGNTMKYVLMGTSSNFGNMFSAAGASLFLPFLPMLPSQILLNNLLYDTSQLAIPTDEVDEEQLHRPSHWDIGLIRRFMLVFGPLSSVFDFATFGIMLWGLSAGPAEFRSGWFVESLATQTLIVLAIRTQRVPFFRSRPSVPLLAAVVGVVAVGTALPFTPLAGPLGFAPLPAGFLAVLVGLVLAYLVLIEVGKRVFYRTIAHPVRPSRPRHPHERHVRRRARRFRRPARTAAGSDAGRRAWDLSP
jgi:Mg2+-importing ATPase